MNDSAETLEAEKALEPGLTENFLGPRVRLLWNLLAARMLGALEPYGLKIGAFSTLALISANPGCSQTELAKGLGMDKSAVVPILDDLEARELIRRVRSQEDRRRHALMITAEGEAVMHRMHASISKAGRPIRDGMSAAEYQQLLRLLERAYQALAASEP